MGSVIFDFDSTLVPVESLEEVLGRAATLAPAQTEEIERITNAGMDGSLSFENSLRQRFAIAQPTLPAVRLLAHELGLAATPGAAELIRRLTDQGHEVWIVSGGLREILEPVGQVLGIPRHRIHGVTCQWAEDGSLVGLDPACGFVVSKVEGLTRLGPAFDGPSIGVGDGATDLALREAGFVEHFVAYTEFVAREGVVAGADHVAENMASLGAVLAKLLS